MRALVLGGSGFIGSHLVDRLVREHDSVRVFDRREELYREPVSGVEYCYGEYGNRALVGAALEQIDTVFHLISTTVPKTSNDDPVFDLMSNVGDTLYLLEQCVERGIKKIVFLSSGGTVYGSAASVPVSEDSPTDPECSYGIGKLTIEKYLALFGRQYGLDYVVLRPSNPYGTRQNPEGIQGAISVFLGRVAAGKPIEIWGDGEIVRDYIFVEDLVDGICRAALRVTPRRIFNLGSGEGHSLNAVVELMRGATGCEIRVVYTPKRSFDVSRVVLDIRRAEEQLGWRPSTSLSAGIEKTWEFVRRIVRGQNCE